MSEEPDHLPVLFEEVLEALNISPSGVYVDGTFGRGGHSGGILDRLGGLGRLIAIDKDPAAVAHAEHCFGGDRRFCIERGSFSLLRQFVEQNGVMGEVGGILLDLGVSSPQLDTPERGFSFLRDGPLDMRMDTGSGLSAAQWLAGAGEQEIFQVLKEYGEERFARRIAGAIVKARREAPIETTGRLAAIVAEANPSWERDKHPATRSFQAIRIHINRELEELKTCLEESLNVLASRGRLVVISFHSLEDRMIKRFIRDYARGDAFPAGVPVTQAQMRPKLRLVGKAIRPSPAEVVGNLRARSAVLRVAERIS